VRVARRWSVGNEAKHWMCSSLSRLPPLRTARYEAAPLPLTFFCEGVGLRGTRPKKAVFDNRRKAKARLLQEQNRF